MLTVVGVQLLGPDKQWPVLSLSSRLLSGLCPPLLLCSARSAHTPHSCLVAASPCVGPLASGGRCVVTRQTCCVRHQPLPGCSSALCVYTLPPLPPATICRPARRVSAGMTTSQVQDTAPKYVLKLTMFYTIYTYCCYAFTQSTQHM